MKLPWDDGILVAYVDGELDESTARAVEAWAAADSEVGLTIRRLHDSVGMLRAAFGGAVHEPLPEGLSHVLHQPPGLRPADSRLPVPRRPVVTPAPSRRWLSVAAVLLLALGAGLGRGWGEWVAWPEGRETPARSFVVEDGRFCREYRIERRGDGAAGLRLGIACRGGGGDWRPMVELVPVPPGSAETR